MKLTNRAYIQIWAVPFFLTSIFWLLPALSGDLSGLVTDRLHALAQYQLNNRPLLLAPHMVPLHTIEGQNRLARSLNNLDQLEQSFQPQWTLSTCAIASSCIALRTLLPSYSAVSEQDFLKTSPSYRKLFAILFSRAGIDLGELKVWLSNKYPLVAADYRAGEYTIDNLRNQIVNSLNTERATKSVALVNFHGSHMGLLMKGHFSVIAGYDEVTDSVLVLDVAKHRLPDYWVPMANLYEGMQAVDVKTHRSRGLLIISNRKMSCGDFYLKL